MWLGTWSFHPGVAVSHLRFMTTRLRLAWLLLGHGCTIWVLMLCRRLEDACVLFGHTRALHRFDLTFRSFCRLDTVGPCWTTVWLLQAFHSEGHRLDASGCRRGALMAGCRCWSWAGRWFFVGSVSQSVTSHSSNCCCYSRHPFKFE